LTKIKLDEYTILMLRHANVSEPMYQIVTVLVEPSCAIAIHRLNKIKKHSQQHIFSVAQLRQTIFYNSVSGDLFCQMSQCVTNSIHIVCFVL